jgi:hypothetical protein
MGACRGRWSQALPRPGFVGRERNSGGVGVEYISNVNNKNPEYLKNY